MPKTNFIVEAVDNLGKDTLINNLQQKLGHYIVHHYQKPIITDKERSSECLNSSEMARLAQERAFELGFQQLHTGIPTIFNRFHIGEYVYGPIYRHYDAEYIFDLEKKYDSHHLQWNTILVLLITTDFSFIEDDGLSFDVTKQRQEQVKFIEAVNKSNLANKMIIDVHDGYGDFRPAEDICDQVIKFARERNILPLVS